MRVRVSWIGVGIALALAGAASSARASLSDALLKLTVIPGGGVGIPDELGGGTLVGSLPDFLTPEVNRIALRGIDFPLPPTTPGFVYSYDPDTGVFTRSRSLGSAFTERPATIGKGRFEVGGSFLWGNLDRIDGGTFGTSNTILQVDLDNGLAFLGGVNIQSFSLQSYNFNLTATYGITDRWDVNLLLPLVYNKLSVRATQVYTINSLADGTELGSTAVLALPRVQDEAFGAGDLFLRTKYRFLDGPVGLAAGLIVRFPSGNTDNFFGLGDYIVTPFLSVARQINLLDWGVEGLTDLHANLGFDADASNLDASRARYNLGVAWQWMDRFAILTDFIGSSGLADDSFEVSNGVGSPYRGVGLTGITQSGSNLNTELFIPRNDILDFAMGVKVAITDSGVAFLGAIIPVNNAGLRADVIPTGGVEFGF